MIYALLSVCFATNAYILYRLSRQESINEDLTKVVINLTIMAAKLLDEKEKK